MNVSVKSMYVLPQKTNSLRAYASIMYEGILINNIVVVEDKEGQARVLPPTVFSSKANQHKKNYNRIVHFYDKEAEINEVVLEAYYKAVAELEANAEVVASETKETAAE